MPKWGRTRVIHRMKPPTVELEERPSTEYTDIDLNEDFDQWLINKADSIKYAGLKRTLTHFRENGLIATFKNNRNISFTNDINISYKIIINDGKGDEGDENGISFDFYRIEGQWRFGIDIEDIEINGIDGKILEIQGLGYARLLMAIMIYCLENYIEIPTDLRLAGQELIIGICADTSRGFWEYMGMKEGRYSTDKDRCYSMTGARAGYDREFQMKDWERWLFSDSKSAKNKARLKNHKPKKHTKRKKKRKSKRKSKKSKMR